MSRYSIGIDFGTLSARAVVMDLSDGKVIATKNNAIANGFVARDKNDIYLGELERSELSDENALIEYYGDNGQGKDCDNAAACTYGKWRHRRGCLLCYEGEAPYQRCRKEHDRGYIFFHSGLRCCFFSQHFSTKATDVSSAF